MDIFLNRSIDIHTDRDPESRSPSSSAPRPAAAPAAAAARLPGVFACVSPRTFFIALSLGMALLVASEVLSALQHPAAFPMAWTAGSVVSAFICIIGSLWVLRCSYTSTVSLEYDMRSRVLLMLSVLSFPLDMTFLVLQPSYRFTVPSLLYRAGRSGAGLVVLIFVDKLQFMDDPKGETFLRILFFFGALLSTQGWF